MTRVQAVEGVVKERINQTDANNLMQPSTVGKTQVITYKERLARKWLVCLNHLKTAENGAIKWTILHRIFTKISKICGVKTYENILSPITLNG